MKGRKCNKNLIIFFVTLVALSIFIVIINNNVVYAESSLSSQTNDDSNITIQENSNSNIIINFNLTNAPNGNNEYCEEMIKNNYIVRFVDKPENSECTNYPHSIILNNDGKLNSDSHTYTKTGFIDFSKTSFSVLGDYYFSIYEEESEKEIYQIIMALRTNYKNENNATNRVNSLIQIKSILQNGEKVDCININKENPNTLIKVKKNKNLNGFDEDVYVDIYIEGYENLIYTLKDGDTIEVPVGTKYKAILTEGKLYREEYELEEPEILRVAQADAEENIVIINYLTNNKPKTGLFYNVVPFAIIILLAIVGIFIIKKLSSKKIDESEESE